MNNGLGGKAMRLIAGATNQHNRLVELFRWASGKFDAAHIVYLVGRDIQLWDLLPDDIMGSLTLRMLGNADLRLCSEQEFFAAALEARPDCTDILSSAHGQEWLRTFFAS